MIDGLSSMHRLNEFAPDAPDLVVLSSKGGDGEARVLLPTRRISYVAFFKETASAAKTDTSALQEYQIGVPGDKRFEMLTDPAAISDPVGFYAVPSGGGSLFSEVFFFCPGVNYLQDSKPLGSMLVDGGHVEQEDIDRGPGMSGSA